MFITLTADDLSSLSLSTKNEILKLAGAAKEEAPSALAGLGEAYKNIDMTGVADLSYRQVQTWMEAASEKTKLGLRIFAEHGPVVRAQALIDAGIDNTSHFQSRTTIRTRTVTGDKEAYLLGWDDWGQAEENQGRYAVTPLTHASLRQYFQLD
ncbi:MAG: hypothetical protein EA385_17305 [Salinarimonadaceae bacterium]|nr:MAG: hypothetical protein EA385_17305 [Salinarimonadaceae bacterium]